MGVWEKVTGFMNISADEFDDDNTEQVETQPEKTSYYSEPERKREPRIFRDERKSRGNSGNTNPQMQVVLVKPERFDDVTMIADHLNAQKSVVLNLESANREVSRRILDFLSGVAYANGGNISRVANNTYMIVSGAVDLLGEHLLDDLTDSSLF